jgi:hypothetical protein
MMAHHHAKARDHTVPAQRFDALNNFLLIDAELFGNMRERPGVDGQAILNQRDKGSISRV